MAFDPSQPFEVEPAVAQPAATPVTHYSQGRSVGGPDEMEDRWTNQGYTATGKNLTDGVVAVNPDVYPLGTILKDADTGEPFLAADRHGNKDPRTVDIYQTPDRYERTSGERRFVVAGRLDKVPDTVEGVRAALATFRGNDGSAPMAAADSALPEMNDPSQSGYFEYQDTDGTAVRRPAMIVRDEYVPPAAPAGFDPSQPFEIEASSGFDPSQPFEPEQSPGMLANIWNSFARGATAEGIYSGTEGAARAAGESLQFPQEQLTEQTPEGGYRMNLWKTLATSIGETLTGYADDTAALREDLRQALPVDEAFERDHDYIAGIAQGAGQLVGQLPQFAIPGMAGVTALGAAYDQQYQDALAHGATPAKAHEAGLIGLPTGALDYVADKFILGKILKPLEGKITVGQAVKYMATASAVEGGTEGTQQFLQNVVAKQLSGYDPDRPLNDQVVKSIIIGGIVGGGATGVGMAGGAALSPSDAPAGGGGIEGVSVAIPESDLAAVSEAFGMPNVAEPVVEFTPVEMPIAKSAPEVPFSKVPATPEHVQAIDGRVAEAVLKVFGNGRGPRPEVVVHAEPGAIPDNALRSAVHAEESKGKGVVDAFLNPADGKIHLIANRLTPDQVEAKIRHEGLHWALRTNENFRADYERMMGNFAETLPAATLRDLRSLYGDDPAKLMEEYMARLAEAEPNSSTWRTFVVKVKALLARYFPGVKFTEADIRAFLNSGMQRRASMEAKPGPIVASKSGDVAEAMPVAPQARRKFIESVKASSAVRPEVKQRLKADFYDPVSNKETVAQARERVKSLGLDAAKASIMDQSDAWNPTAVDYAMGTELISHFQAVSRFTDAAAIADKMAAAATEQGRAIQALSLIARLTPEGLQMFGARQIDAATRADPEIKRLYGEITRLREELAKAKFDPENKDAGYATQAVLDVQRYLAEALADKGARLRANLALRDALAQTWEDPAHAVAAFKRILERFGITAHNADRIAKRLANAARERGKKSREDVLKKIKTAGERRIPAGATERLLRLNREGRLDDSSIFGELAKIAGVPIWTPAMSGQAKRLALEHERASDPEVKLVLAARMLDLVRGMTPPSVWAKARGLQNLAMLLNPKTVIRNLGGNQVLWAVDVPADALTMVADAAVGLVTKKRTRASLDIAARLSGLAQPVRDYWNGYGHARTGGASEWQSFQSGMQHMIDIARLTSAGKMEIAKVDGGLRKTFSAPVLSHLEDALTLLLGTGDRMYFASALQSSISRQMNAAKATGSPVAAPTSEMMAEALSDAQAAIYQNENAASHAGQLIRNALNIPRPVGGKFVKAEYGLGNAILPFVQVPGAILTKSLEFSPAGFLMQIYDVGVRQMINRGEFRQKEFTQAIGRAFVGTAIMTAGWWLAKLGILTALPDEDKDVAAMQKASGMGAFSFNASALKRAMLSGNWWMPQPAIDGDVIWNYAWLAPISVALAAGAQVHQSAEASRLDELKNGNAATVAKMLWASTMASANVFLEQSFLSGMKDFNTKWSRDGLPEAVGQTLLEMPLQFIPTVVRQFKDLRDNTMRETSGGTVVDRVMSRAQASIPGLSEKLPPNYDVLGNAEEKYQYSTNTLLNVFFNPAFVTRYKANPVLQEAESVYRATSDKGVLPDQMSPTLQIDGMTVRLTNEELADYQYANGQYASRGLSALLADPRWAGAPMEVKADEMARVMSAAHKAAKSYLYQQQSGLVDRIYQQVDQRDAARATAVQ